MNTTQTPLMTLDHATLGYQRQPVLSDITLSLHSGQLTALFGANGSGKSTILKTLVGILPLIKGEFLYHDNPDPSRFRYGYVPQRETLDSAYPLSATDIVLMGTLADEHAWFLTRISQRGMAHHLLEQVGLTEHRDRLFTDLSVGQKQRVLIARALATQPDCLVMDEPTSGVDIESTETMFTLFEGLKENDNLTILIVSHEIDEITNIADKVVRIHHGTLVDDQQERSNG